MGECDEVARLSGTSRRQQKVRMMCFWAVSGSRDEFSEEEKNRAREESTRVHRHTI